MALAVVELYCYATICSNPPFSPLISGPEASFTSTNRACAGPAPLSVHQAFTSPTTALMTALGVLRTVRHQMVASQVSRNSTAVGSAPDQTATFPEKSLVHLLAVVVGGWCWGCGGLVGFIFACFTWTLMSV